LLPLCFFADTRPSDDGLMPSSLITDGRCWTVV
jgi:hypothetical protein